MKILPAVDSLAQGAGVLLERTCFLQALAKQISLAQENERMSGIVLVQIGNLDAINEECGYAEADIVIEEFVGRLAAHWCTHHTVGRLTHSKVAIALHHLAGPGQLNLAANKIQESFDQPVPVNGKAIRLRVVVSGAMATVPEADSERLMWAVECALGEANQRADGIYMVSPTSDSVSRNELTLETELASAINNGEIELYYQPKIELRTGVIVGVEALARWSSTSQGVVRPDVFIGIAERSGLILPLTLLTLNIALRQCAEFQNTLGGISVAVNLSAAILSEPDVDQLIERAMTIWGIDPCKLILEVTESAMMEDPAAALAMLRRLRDTGARVSIDDFGTGYSSLAYLKNLPVNELKIDKSFVMNMVKNEDDAKIVKSIIDLAHNFELTVVAEGIEDQQTLDSLTSFGCEVAQGFYLGRPLPIDSLLEWNAQSPWGR